MENRHVDRYIGSKRVMILVGNSPARATTFTVGCKKFEPMSAAPHFFRELEIRTLNPAALKLRIYCHAKATWVQTFCTLLYAVSVYIIIGHRKLLPDCY